MIEKAVYTSSNTIEVVIDGVTWSVPDDMSNTHRQMLAEWEAEGNVISPYNAPAIDLVAYTADKRWQKETGGCYWKGYPVHTDRESQAKIAAESLAVERGVRSDSDYWKFADGQFRQVSNEEFIDLATTVRNHVRDCFTIEAVVLEKLRYGLINSTVEIDQEFQAHMLNANSIDISQTEITSSMLSQQHSLVAEDLDLSEPELP